MWAQISLKTKPNRLRTLTYFVGSDMNKTIRIGLLAAILAAQLLTLIGGFIAYEQLSETIWRLKWDYKQLYEETHDLIIDYGPEPNPFAPLVPLILSSILLAVAANR